MRHGLLSLLAIALAAVQGGAVSFREIGDYAADLSQDSLRRAHARWCTRRRRWIPPSEATLRRAVQSIDAAVFDEVIATVVTTHTATEAPEAPALTAIAVDGKTMRGGWVADIQVRLFAAMRHDGVVLAQRRVPQDTTEVTQVTALLAGIDLTGTVITADAAHANPRFARHIRARDGDYLVTVKFNRPALIAAIQADLRATGATWHTSEEHTRGRIIRRRIRIAPTHQVTYPGATRVFQVLRETFDLSGTRHSKDLAHGVTSLHPDQATPAEVSLLTRQHWHIENKLHWVRDVVYREDHHRTYRGNGSQVMATLRNLALSIIRLADLGPVTRTLQHLNRDQARTLTLLGL